MDTYKLLGLSLMLTVIIGMVGTLSNNQTFTQYENTNEYNQIKTTLDTKTTQYDNYDLLTSQEDSSQLDSGSGGFSETMGSSSIWDIFRTAWQGYKTGLQQVYTIQNNTTDMLNKIMMWGIAFFYTIIHTMLILKFIMIIKNRDTN